MPRTRQGPPRPRVVERDPVKGTAKEGLRGVRRGIPPVCKHWKWLSENWETFPWSQFPLCRAGITVPQRSVLSVK